MSDFRYRLTDAALQLGTEPPFNCISIPVRMSEWGPQIKVGSDWIMCRKDEPNPVIGTFLGHPVAGIATTWEIDRDPPVKKDQ